MLSLASGVTAAPVTPHRELAVVIRKIDGIEEVHREVGTAVDWSDLYTAVIDEGITNSYGGIGFGYEVEIDRGTVLTVGPRAPLKPGGHAFRDPNRIGNNAKVINKGKVVVGKDSEVGSFNQWDAHGFYNVGELSLHDNFRNKFGNFFNFGKVEIEGAAEFKNYGVNDNALGGTFDAKSATTGGVTNAVSKGQAGKWRGALPDPVSAFENEGQPSDILEGSDPNFTHDPSFYGQTWKAPDDDDDTSVDSSETSSSSPSE
jgi:hypothetical protein